MDYVTRLRKYEKYKWYKPLLEIVIVEIGAVLATILCVCLSSLICFVNGGDVAQMIDNLQNGYDSFDAYSLAGVINSLGRVACLIPVIAIATKIVRIRPFHTVVSSSGGFDIKIFFKAFLIAIVVVGIPVAVNVFANVDTRGPIGSDAAVD